MSEQRPGDGDVERELHRRLTQRADEVAVDDNWGDLVDRMTRSNRRTTRALSLALVLVVCLATVGVVVVARRDEGGPANTARNAKSGPASVQATGALVPKVLSASEARTFASAKSAGPGGVTVTTLVPPEVNIANGAIGAYVVAGGRFEMLGGSGMDMAKVFTRTTANGVTIRTYRADVEQAAVVEGPPWWKAPEWCYPSGYAQADVSNSAIAGVAFAPLYSAQKDGSTVGGTLTVMGQNEKAVQWVVVAQGPANTKTLRATFPDGSHDEMAPVDGVAVLVGGGPGDESKAHVMLTAVDASGATIGTGNVDTISGGLGAWKGDEPNSECMPPQDLPAPGAEQPADPTAAEAAVRAAFAKAYAKGIDDAGFRATFDDSHGFAEVQRQLFNGTFKEQVKGAVQTLDDVVFLSPTTAAIKYHIDVPGYSAFTNRFNEVHLIDGQWKLSRAGWCTDVSLAGVHCPA